MKTHHLHCKIKRTSEEAARLRADRERYQRERPTPQQLLAEGGHKEFVKLGELLLVHQAASWLKQERERQNLTLAEVSKRTGIDQAAISRLETGKNSNPTLDTLYRIASALGKPICFNFQDAEKTPQSVATKDDRFHQDMQRYIAVITVGSSTLRNQGASEVIEAAQNFLAAVALTSFSARNENEFLTALDMQTEQLQKALPQGAQNWGAARKALNLFLQNICYNRFLCERYGLAESEEWMEIPLDDIVVNKGLKRIAGRGKLPHWPGLKNLTADVSRSFQNFAREFAATKGMSRIHLNMRLWTALRKGVRSISEKLLE